MIADMIEKDSKSRFEHRVALAGWLAGLEIYTDLDIFLRAFLCSTLY